jgi:helix-turn-helix protein
MVIAESASVSELPPGASSNEELMELLTAAEAAQFLKVTVSWVYEHVRPEAEDRLPFLKLGKYLRFDVRDLRIYIDGKRHAARHSRRRR